MIHRNRLVSHTLLVVFAALMVAGCKPRIPGKYLSKSKMEDILYDYHLADAMSSVDGDYNDTLRTRIYKLSVLQKHGVSEADFDSSMVYYVRHAEHMRDIYDHLSKRLSDEAMALGASTSEVNQYLTLSETGDTANIWKGDRSFILSMQPGFNVYPFSLKADTTFEAGDRFILTFDTKFVFQDGMRDGVALLAITFDNDSVASHMTRITMDNQYRIDINDSKRMGIKMLSGYFALNRNQNSDSQTTLKLMHVGNITLIRMHVAEEKENEDDKPGAKGEESVGRIDSLASDSGHNHSLQSPSRDLPLKRDLKPVPVETRTSNQ